MVMTALSSTDHAGIAAICRHWLPGEDFCLQPVAGSGFSGSPVFIVESRRGRHILKAFPPQTSWPRTRWVHGLMHHLAAAGIETVAPPLATASGESFAADGNGRLWELLPFLNGSPAADPAEEQLATAVAALARLHAAAASYPACLPDRGPSAGIVRRISQAGRLLEEPWSRLPSPRAAETSLAAEVAGRVPAAAATLETAAGRRVLAALATATPRPVPRQAVLRDIWSDHVLFALPGKTRVAGFLDFHAAERDTPATDFARLLGSWLPAATETAAARWRTALAAADEKGGRSPEPTWLARVRFLAASGVVFGLGNWFRWIFSDGRQFPDHAAVLARIDRLSRLLPGAFDEMAETLENPGLTLKNCSL
jgi:Ser/Thr protein kinase RdoA (MazF antagonist)